VPDEFSGPLSIRQLAAVAELVRLADQLRIPVWLRGGWAVDFALGRLTRDHVDIDWFAPADRAEGLITGLTRVGFTMTGAAPPEQQVDLARDDVEHGIAWLRFNDEGNPLVAGGPWAGEPWPSGMLDGPVCTLGQVTARVISVEAQITIKKLTPTWQPHLSHRAKDLEDVRLLEEWSVSDGFEF
jgi:hypothetical protein